MLIRKLLKLLIVFCLILASQHGSSAVDSMFESCDPENCGNGPVIRFPFFIPGYPGFRLNCYNNDFPLLQLLENNYVVERIYYERNSFRVYDEAVSTTSNHSSCPRIRNTTLPTTEFHFHDDVIFLHLLSNCSDRLSGNLQPCRVYCESDDDDLTLAVYR
ncbi:hypothetical protein BUALT_Bualt05G0128100 [Buddleja alternifolia]|uniref:Wall-associated receptor kinase galacturonan-binding domain-containing protein n=1 Tax=Buddleja alternifolia TaxID=168488 RepID=A0AAV6XKQ4_9LAMI|nr:hypothetical protein BUALT_Bualt05G0128100 [Buddleja alternifolia]